MGTITSDSSVEIEINDLLLYLMVFKRSRRLYVLFILKCFCCRQLLQLNFGNPWETKKTLWFGGIIIYNTSLFQWTAHLNCWQNIIIMLRACKLHNRWNVSFCFSPHSFDEYREHDNIVAFYRRSKRHS